MTQTSLGKIIVTPRGEFNIDTQYEPLDIVAYKNGSYLVTKTVKGIEPTNGEYYFAIANGNNIEKIIADNLNARAEAGEFDGQRGPSGVYVGEGEIPEDCNVQIDPDGKVYTKDELQGESAYDLAVRHGFVGTEAEWVESLKGKDYQITESDYQDITENVLETDTVKKLVADTDTALKRSAEAIDLAKQINYAYGFDDYAALISELNAAPVDKYKIGQDIFIVKSGIPDLWIAGVEDTSVQYNYTSDEQVIEDLTTGNTIQIGYYVVGTLETLKQDLSNYVKNTDYATNDIGGVVKVGTGDSGIISDSDNRLSILAATEEQINAKTHLTKPIVPATLDHAVKVGITTNDIPLTEAEQAAAQSWLGGQMIKEIPKDSEGNANFNAWEWEVGVYRIPANTKIYTYSNKTGPRTSIYDYYLSLSECEYFYADVLKYDGKAFQTSIISTTTYYNSDFIYWGYTDSVGNGTLREFSLYTASHRTSAETISGIKTFSAQPIMTAELAANDNSTNIPNTQWVQALVQKTITEDILTPIEAMIDESGVLDA